MGNLYYDYKPEMYQLKMYLGKGKHGGFVFEVATGHMNSEYDIGETSEIMVLLTKDEYDKLGENEQLKAQVVSMKKALNLISGYSKCGCMSFIEDIAKEALSENTTEKYHNPVDITLLRKAKDSLKQGIKQLEKYINYFEQTLEEDACIEMHETVLEIDKVLECVDR